MITVGNDGEDVTIEMSSDHRTIGASLTPEEALVHIGAVAAMLHHLTGVDVTITTGEAPKDAALSPSVQRFAEAMEKQILNQSRLPIGSLLASMLDDWIVIRKSTIDVRGLNITRAALLEGCVRTATCAMAIHDKHLPKKEKMNE